MKTFYTILIASLTALVIVFGGIFYFLNFMTFDQMGFLTIHKSQNFGTALTDLSSSDTMSDFPTLYNANNSLLYNEKISVGTTSIPTITTLAGLSSIGTITTGTWNGTAITVNKGGTGTTSPTLYMVILGNGTAGLTHASSTGTSGQFLTSNGSGAYPSWASASVDTSINYAWTGSHYFNASSTFAASNLTTLTVKFNGLAYQWPSVRSVASSTLTDNGSGTLSWGIPSRLIYSNATDVTLSNTTASTTIISTTIPANWLGMKNIVKWRLNWYSGLRTYTAPYRIFIEILYGSQSSTYAIANAADWTGYGYFEGMVQAANSTSTQEVSLQYFGTEGSSKHVMNLNIADQGATNALTVNSTVAQTLVIKLRFQAADASDAITIENSYVELLAL